MSDVDLLRLTNLRYTAMKLVLPGAAALAVMPIWPSILGPQSLSIGEIV